MRFWLSGVSFGWEDFRPRRQAMAALPSYRRYELRHGLQEAAKASGKPIGKRTMRIISSTKRWRPAPLIPTAILSFTFEEHAKKSSAA